MKTSIKLGICATIIAATGFTPASFAAENPPPATQPAPAAPAPPTGDPFVKKDAPPVEEPGPAYNIILTFDTYTLSQADGAKLLQENQSDQDRYDHVRELVKAGKAHLDSVLSTVSKSGFQAVTEEVDITPYAIGFKFGDNKTVYGTDYKKRNVGRRLVTKGQTISGTQNYDESFFYETTTLDGFALTNANDGPGAVSVAQPKFSTQRVNTKPPFLPYGQIRFLGTYNSMPEASWSPKAPAPGDKPEDAAVTLVFEKANQVPLDPGTLKDVKPAHVELETSLYSLDREKALEILNGKQEMDSAYQAVQALVKADQAKLEHLTVLRTATGVKANVDEVHEFTYSTGISNEFNSQDIGFNEEMNPSFPGASPLLTIDISKCQLLNYVGNLHVEGISAPYEETQPVFCLQSDVTTINSALGEHELLGTISPPSNTGVNGRKDTGRVWLAFLKTTPVNP